MPYVEPSLVECLLSQAEGVNAVVPVVRGHYEPLCAAYRKTCIEPIEGLIMRNVLKASELYPLVDVCEVSEDQIRRRDPELRSFLDLNAPVVIKQPAQPRQKSCVQHP